MVPVSAALMVKKLDSAKNIVFIGTPETTPAGRSIKVIVKQKRKKAYILGGSFLVCSTAVGLLYNFL